MNEEQYAQKKLQRWLLMTKERSMFELIKEIYADGIQEGWKQSEWKKKN